MKKIAEEKRREKIEDRLARERVKKQIEADKIVRYVLAVLAVICNLITAGLTMNESEPGV